MKNKIHISIKGSDRAIKSSTVQMAISNGRFMDISVKGKWYTTTLTKNEFEKIINI